MDYKKQTGRTIDEAFVIFDKDNPQIYQLFVRFAIQAINKGMKRIGGRFLFERIRWEVYVETSAQDYKINNNFAPHYVRKFIREYPDWANRFETRRLRADSIPVDDQGQVAMDWNW